MEVVALAIFASICGNGVAFSLTPCYSVSSEGRLLEDIILEMKNDFHNFQATVLNILKDREQNFKSMFVAHQADVSQKISAMKPTGTLAQTEGNVTRAVSFSAYSPQKTTFNDGESVIFQTLFLNQGNCYNTGTGIFTVPYRGTYFFLAHVCNAVPNCASISIMHKEEQLTKISVCDESGNPGCVSSSAVVHAEVGDKIWLKIINPSYLSENPHRGASFMGFLIHSD